MINKIKEILKEISALLYQNAASDWADCIDELCSQINTDPDEAVANIKRLYGGMGSLSDLVFSKNGVPLRDETNQLDELRKELYILCSSYKYKN
ncbi:DUF6966 domain-containing protein [Photorhabdus sp. SF281]|uniref:DUF6966 domain-containing protein n=1 Tax=Photorhabdus sp. SF281 TaxID=3459527 RepID=UPI0040445818